MKRYYYIYTSLKDLTFDLDKNPSPMRDLFKLLEEELDPGDLSLIRAFFYRYDNQNLVGLLEKKEEWNEMGTFEKEELIEEIKIPVCLPHYMKQFLVDMADDMSDSRGFSLEDQLAIYYYHFLIGQPSIFLKKYTDFEFNLKNILVALNCRKFSLSSDKNVLLLNEEAGVFSGSSTADFNLSKNFPWISDVIRIFEDNDMIEKEKNLDRFRFEMISSLLTFEYFTIDRILGYIMQLTIIQRWLKMDYHTGIGIFENVTNEMVGKVDTEKEL